MTDIDKLYDALHKIFPIPLVFKKDLKPLIEKKSFKNLNRLLKTGKYAKKAWHILSGYIIAMEGTPRKNCAVKRICYVDDITTDLKSFFENVTCTYNWYGLNLIAQEIEKENFKKLGKHPETDELVKRIMVKDGEEAMKRADLIAIQHQGERVKAFLQDNPALELPNQLAASFLAMSEEIYTEEKCILIEQGFEFNGAKSTDGIVPEELAYKCKLFLKQHFKSNTIGNTTQIAAQLFTTPKTLTRAMTKLFGLTTHEYLTKLRMEYAQELLIQKIPVNQVSGHVGCADQAAFSKTYKKYFGHCPKDAHRLR